MPPGKGPFGVDAANPGGPWVWRGALGNDLATAGRKVAQPPSLEAAAIAWKAARKATLQGNLGTGNRISAVIQYPISTRDPFNCCRGSERHLSAEERRILRSMVKHHMRRFRGQPVFSDSVYLVEKEILRAFADSATLRKVFYTNETTAKELLDQAAHAFEGAASGQLARSQSEPGLARSVSTSGGDPGARHVEHCVNKSFIHLRPASHSVFCGPQCYCLRFQDAALSAHPELSKDASRSSPAWEENFALKTKGAASSVLDAVTATTLRRTAPPGAVGSGRAVRA